MVVEARHLPRLCVQGGGHRQLSAALAHTTQACPTHIEGTVDAAICAVSIRNLANHLTLRWHAPKIAPQADITLHLMLHVRAVGLW